MKTKGLSQDSRRMAVIILSLAWPTMLEQLLQTAVQYIDTAMVGSLGTQATAAVGATVTINWLISTTIAAISVGFLAFISQICNNAVYKVALKLFFIFKALLSYHSLTIFTVAPTCLRSLITANMYII